MKTIANCTPSEFLKQSWAIYGKLRELFEKANVAEIRKMLPKFDGNETDEEKAAKLKEQGKENLLKIVEKLLDEYPAETAKVLGLMCFIPENEIDKHTGVELLLPAVEIISNEQVVSFFSSLLK